MPPRRKATTAAAPPAVQEAQTTELDEQIQSPSSDDPSTDNMVDVSAFLELGDTQPTARPSSLLARPRRADKGKGRAILGDPGSSPRSPTSPRVGPSHETAIEGNGHAEPAAPAAPPVVSPHLSPCRDSISVPQTGRDRIPTILGRRRRDSRDIPPLSPERITLTRAELEELLRAHTARAGAHSSAGSPAHTPGAQGAVSWPGEVPLGERPWKCSRHFPLAEDQGLAPIDPNAIIVPRKVVAALEQGMLQYIPLHILTVKACREAARTAEMDKQWKHSLQLEGGTISLKPASFDSSGEKKLRPLEWVDAAGRYIALLRKHLWAGGDDAPGGRNAQTLADQWESHFRLIQAQSHFEERFSVYLEYDIRIRQLWVLNPNTIWPGSWHNALFDSIVRDEIFTCIWPGGSSAQSAGGTTQSFRRNTTTPYSSASSSTSSATSGSTPRTGDGDKRPSARCMYCGSRSHAYRQCTGGGKSKIIRDDTGIWCDAEGRTYCIGFNGPRPCKCKEACTHIHACSLCLQADHGAQSCSV